MYLYLDAIYFVIMTISAAGYGNILPLTNREMIAASAF